MLYDVCVIGGGISGASFAYHCANAGAKVLLLEASDQFGCIASHDIGNNTYIELGAHGMTNRYREVIALIESLKLEDTVRASQPLKLKLKCDGHFYKPLQKLSWTNLAPSLPRALWTPKSDKTLAQYYGSITGRKNYTTLLRPAFKAVLSQNPDHFPAELLFKKRERRKDWPAKFTLDGGFERLVHALRTHKGISLQTNSRANSVTRRNETYEVTTTSGTFNAQTIALAVPPNVAAELTTSIAPDASALLSQIDTTRIQTTLVRTNHSNRPQHGAFFSKGKFFSMINAADGHYVFHAQLSNAAANTEEFAEALGVPSDSLEIIHHRQATLPIITQNTRLEVEKLNYSELFFPCNYINGLSLEDCCAQSAKEFNRWRRSAGL